MRRLAALVLLASAAVPLAPARAASDPGRAQQWALDHIDAGTAHGQGAGTVVAVIDSGVDLQHVDLRDQLLPGVDLVDGDEVAQDENGHGTHVAGIIAAAAGNGVGIAGVAPKAKLLPVRVLDANGNGDVDDVAEGIRWAVAHGADVVNLSIGEDTQTLLGPSLGDAIEDAWDAGVVAVVAAGNDYLLGSGFSDEPALVVSATTRDDGAPSYAGGGVGAARWSLAAPGGEDPAAGDQGAVLSTFWAAGKQDQYAYDSGTSMAAPHVAGAIAVLLGLGYTPQQAVDRVLTTARDIGKPGHDTLFGAGLLDLGRATASDGVDPENTEVPTSTTATPSPSTTSSPTVTAGGAPSTTVRTVEPAPSTTTKLDDIADRRSSDGDDDDSVAVPGFIAAVLAAGAAVAALRVRQSLAKASS